MTHKVNRRGGQAMAEAVTVVAVLIPLFLLIPMIGKIGEIKAKSIEAARYASWERTVYFGHTLPNLPDQKRPVNLAQKSNATIAREAYVRTFSGADVKITAEDGVSGSIAATGLNTVMKDYRGAGLLAAYSTAGEGAATSDSEPKSPLTGLPLIQNLVITVLDFVNGGSSSSSVWGDIVKYLTGGRFFLSVNGLVTSTVSVSTNKVSGLKPFDNLALTFHQSHTVMSDSWNAAGPEHVRTQVAPFVPGGIININNLFKNDKIGGVIALILSLITPEFGLTNNPLYPMHYQYDPNYEYFRETCVGEYSNCDGSSLGQWNQQLNLGKLDVEAVPCDRLEGEDYLCGFPD